MTRTDRPRLVVEGRIVSIRDGYLFETRAGGPVWRLALEEDPAGFVGVSVRAEGLMIEQDRFAILAMRHLRKGADPSDSPPGPMR